MERPCTLLQITTFYQHIIKLSLCGRHFVKQILAQPCGVDIVSLVASVQMCSWVCVHSFTSLPQNFLGDLLLLIVSCSGQPGASSMMSGARWIPCWRFLQKLRLLWRLCSSSLNFSTGGHVWKPTQKWSWSGLSRCGDCKQREGVGASHDAPSASSSLTLCL